MKLCKLCANFYHFLWYHISSNKILFDAQDNFPIFQMLQSPQISQIASHLLLLFLVVHAELVVNSRFLPVLLYSSIYYKDYQYFVLSFVQVINRKEAQCLYSSFPDKQLKRGDRSCQLLIYKFIIGFIAYPRLIIQGNFPCIIVPPSSGYAF